MYIPEAMKMKDNDKIYQYLEQNGFAMLVSSSLAASHLPCRHPLLRDGGETH
ncbi:FMN-binding negative transcriptional regulator [Erwinia mallotivora]|uniref:FMN-binding negative transcriptional regulator n=1 Tax=Erwinia mallotivora TaxID=69222 RepID=UPI0004BC33AB|nr:FMN-binding negative transcriptional regulator [Erwinia mallotivora]